MPNIAGWMNTGGTTLLGTATIATNGTITLAAHGLATGDIVEFTATSGGAIGVLVDGAEYYVRNPVTNSFQVSDTPGGELITFASTGGAEVRPASPSYAASDWRRLGAINAHPASADRWGARTGVRPHSTAAVTLSGTTWTVAETLAWMYPRETSTSGPYPVAIERTEGTLTAADGSNPRLDALDVYIQDDDEDGSVQRRVPPVLYTAGAPASSPTAPTLLPGRLRLATILVPAGGSPAPSIQTPAQFYGGPGILIARNSTELPSTGMPEGAYVDRWDTDTLYRWDGAALQPVASQAAYNYWLATTGGSAVTNWTAYTPTWTGIGSATFASNVGRWMRTGPKAVEFKFHAVISTAGSGSSVVQMTAPFAPSRVMNQTGGLHVKGSPTPALRDGLWESFTTGTGTTLDRVLMDNGLGSVSNIVGSDLVAGLAIVGGGTIMEA